MNSISIRDNYKLVTLSNLPSFPSTQQPGEEGGGIKIRLIARVIGIDPSNDLILIIDQEIGLIVKFTLILDDTLDQYGIRLKDLVMISGDLVLSPKSIPIPPIQTPHSSPLINTNLLLIAKLIKQVEEVDLEKWRGVVGMFNRGN